jgi:hypothetical protein
MFYLKLCQQALLVNHKRVDGGELLAMIMALIKAWHGEYKEERRKKALGGLTPAAYARLLTMNAVTVNTVL